MAITAAELQVILTAKDEMSDKLREVVKDVAGVDKGMVGAGKAAGGFGSILSGMLGAQVITSGFRMLKDGIASFIEEAGKAQTIDAQLDAVLTSTGGVAGVTKQAVLDLSDSLSQLTPIEDDAITSAQNMMLTFTNVGKDVFPDATKAMLDMATAMNGGAAPSAEQLKSTAIQLGKALNDPVIGVTALQRVGVRMTESQKETIKTLVEMGDTAAAQRIILDELKTEFSGSAEAAGKTFPGQLAILKNSIGNVKEAIGTAFLPVLTDLAKRAIPFVVDATKKVGPTLERISEGLKPIITQADKTIEALGPLWEIFKGMFYGEGINAEWLSEVFQNIGVPTGLADAISRVFGVIGDAMAVVRPIVDGFIAHLEPLWEIMKGFFYGEGVNADWLAEIFSNIGIPPEFGESIARAVGVMGDVFAETLPAIMAFGDQFRSVFMSAWTLVQGVMPAIQSVIGAALGMIMSHWQTVFPMMLAIFQTVWASVQSVIQAAIPVIVGLVNMLAPIIAEAMAFVSRVVGEVVAFVTPLIQQMVEFATKQFQVVLAWVTENMPLIKQTIETVLHAIESVWNAVWPIIQQVVVTVFETIKPVIEGAMQFILGVIKAIMQAINGDWAGAWESVKKAAEAIWQGLIEGVKNLLNGIIGIFVGAKGDFVAQGIAIIEGFMDGVRQKASDMINMVKGYVSDAIQAAKNVLGIHSPSAVFANIGLETMLGFAEGIDEGQLDVMSRVTGVIQDVIGVMRDLPRIAIDAMPDADAFASIGATLKTSFTNIIEILEELWPWMQSRGIAPDVMQTRAGQLSAIISALTSINFGNIADAKVPSGEQWAKYFYAIQHIGGGIYDLVSQFSAEVVRALPLASAAAKDVAGLFAVLAFDPTKVAEAKIPTGEQWGAYFRALRHMGGMIYNLIRDTSLDIADSVAKAGEVAKSIQNLFALVTIDFSAVKDAKLPSWAEWSAYFEAVKKVGGRIYDFIMDTSIDLGESIGQAGVIAGDIAKLFDLLKIEFDLPTIGEGFLDGVRQFIGILGQALDILVPALLSIKDEWGEALEIVAPITDALNQMLTGFASALETQDKIFQFGGFDVDRLATLAQQAAAIPQAAVQGINATPQLLQAQPITINFTWNGADMGDYITQMDGGRRMDVDLASLMAVTL